MQQLAYASLFLWLLSSAFLRGGDLGHTRLWERGVCPWILAEGVRVPPLESRAFWMKILLKGDLASASDIKVESS